MVCGFSFGCEWYPPAVVIDSDSANLILDQFILHVIHFPQTNLSHLVLERQGLNEKRCLEVRNEVSRGEESVSGSTGTMKHKAV